MSTSSFGLRNILKIQIILPVLSSLLLVAILTRSPYAAFFFILGIAITLSLAKNPLMALALLIILVPLNKTHFFAEPLLGIKGTEPYYMLAFFVLFIGIINLGYGSKMPKIAVAFSFFFIVIFALTVIHSLSNVAAINERFIEEGRERLSTFPYLLKTFVRPMLYFIPFLLITKFANTYESVDFVTRSLIYSVIFLSLYIIVLFIFKFPSIKDAGSVNYSLGVYLGMLRNDIANFYILGFPFLLSRFFVKKNLINLSIIGLSLFIVAFLYSRTAYIIIFLSFILYLFISKRTRFLPILMALAIVSSVILSASIIQRASHGFESNDLNEITSGRTGNIWMPLIHEYFTQPKKLLLGNGRYAIVSSQSVARGFTPNDIWHPHNMYLEQILDAGLIAFIIISSFYIIFFRKIFRSFQLLPPGTIKEYQYAVFVSMSAYFISGLTGRTLFPSSGNNYFWIILAIGVVIINLRNKELSQTAGNGSLTQSSLRNESTTLVQKNSFASRKSKYLN